MADIEEILTLEQLEKDIFRGNVTPSNLRRTFGGQVAGQSLVSAVRTVEPEYLVHSLHGYFLRPGNPNEPTVFLVDRVRDGRSFVTRRVTAIQDGQAIFSMSASFQTLDTGIEHQDLMPPVPDPEDLPDAQEQDSFNRDLFRQFAEWDIRIVPDELRLNHVAVVSDSYTTGTKEGGLGAKSWTSIAWRILNREGVRVSADVAAEGRAGYGVRGDHGSVFADLTGRVVHPDDELVVFFGSRNACR